jgi:hypothetical protein
VIGFCGDAGAFEPLISGAGTSSLSSTREQVVLSASSIPEAKAKSLLNTLPLFDAVPFCLSLFRGPAPVFALQPLNTGKGARLRNRECVRWLVNVDLLSIRFCAVITP